MTLIIAEIGVNHNGDEALAFELVRQAKIAGADCVKFQTFKASELVTENAVQASYQKVNSQIEESQLSMLSRLELSHDAHRRLLDYCQSQQIKFLSTAFDFSSLNFLHSRLKLDTLKLGSGELTNAPLLLAHARTDVNLIVSTGMASLADIELALSVLAFGYLDKTGEPSIEAFEQAYLSEAGQKKLQQKVTILHCTSQYPAPMTDINLKAMKTLQTAFDLPVGYSDHSSGIAIPIAAVSIGANVIEKHFTLDKNLAGPDHKASLEPAEFERMVTCIREVELALGQARKWPQVSELETRRVARKSLVAAQMITQGQLFDESNLAIKRPGDGLSPVNYWRFIGKPAQRDYKPGYLIVD